jgi:hypothetical protein
VITRGSDTPPRPGVARILIFAARIAVCTRGDSSQKASPSSARDASSVKWNSARWQKTSRNSSRKGRLTVVMVVNSGRGTVVRSERRDWSVDGESFLCSFLATVTACSWSIKCLKIWSRISGGLDLLLDLMIRGSAGTSQNKSYSFMRGKPDFDLLINAWRRYKAAGTTKTQRSVANIVNDVSVGDRRG